MELKVIKTKEQYEDTHYPIPMPDPIDAIRVKMNEDTKPN